MKIPPCVALYDLPWTCLTYSSLVWPFMSFKVLVVFYGFLRYFIAKYLIGLVSSFLAAMDPNSFGLVGF